MPPPFFSKRRHGAIRSAQFCVPTGFGNHVAKCLPRCTRRGRVHRGIPAATLVLISVTGNSCRRLLNEGAENQHENVRVNSIGMTLSGRRSSEDRASQRPTGWPTLSIYRSTRSTFASRSSFGPATGSGGPRALLNLYAYPRSLPVFATLAPPALHTTCTHTPASLCSSVHRRACTDYDHRNEYHTPDPSYGPISTRQVM